MTDGHKYDPAAFLKNFPGCMIQYMLDNKAARTGDTHTIRRKYLDQEEAVRIQEEGYGVFFSVNGFKDGDRKESNLYRINALYVDLDVAKEADKLSEEDILARKAIAWEKTDKFVLKPHFVTETKNGFHLIWLTDDVETQQEFVELCKALATHFDGDFGSMAVNKLLRIPGFYHLKDVKAPFLCELMLDNSSMPRYGKQEFIDLLLPSSAAEADSRSEKTPDALPSQEIQKACQMPVRDAMELSASLVGMEIGFRENADGSLQIIENGEETSGFISSRGNFVHSSSGKKREGNAITVAEYYLNEVGGQHYNRQKIAEILLGKTHVENIRSETEQLSSDELPIDEFENIRHRNFPKMAFVVDGLIVKGALNMIVGDPGSHKTWFYQYIAYCIAHGLPVLGKYATFPTHILIVNVDDPLPLTIERLEEIGLDETKHTNIFIWEKEVFMMDLEENDTLMESLMDYVKQNDIGLVIFDTLRQIHSGDENDSGDMTKVMKNLKRFAQESKAAVVVVHHQRKSDGGIPSGNIHAPSGSIAIMGNVFSSLHLSKMKDGTIKVSKGKSKSNIIMEPFYVRMDSSQKGQDFFSIVSAPARIDIEGIQEKIKDFYDENPQPGLTKKDFLAHFTAEIKAPKKQVAEAFKGLEEEAYVVWDGINRPKNVKYYIKSPELT